MGRNDENETTRVEHALWSARSTGARMILPSGSDSGTVAELTDMGLVRKQLGHLVLTPKGMERRRRCSPYRMALA